MTRHLLHITIDTGDSAMIPSSHLKPATRDLLRPMIETAASSRVAEVPSSPDTISGDGWRLIGEHLGAAAIFTLGWMEGRYFHPAVWLGVARRSRSGASLWRLMHRPPQRMPFEPRTDINRQPKTPWLATRPPAGVIGLRREQVEWTADFAEDLAWAWLLDFSGCGHMGSH